MRIILKITSRLLYLMAVGSWLAAASPAVEAAGFQYRILTHFPGGAWLIAMLAGFFFLTLGATFSALARIEEDLRVIRRISTERRR